MRRKKTHRRIPLPVLAAVLLSTCFAPLSSAQDVIGTAAVGVVLSRLMDQLEQAIDQAKNAGLTLEINAGREVSIAIANAQNAYGDILDKTVNTVDPKVKGALDQLQSMVNDIKSGADVTVADVATRAQQVVNSLPFRQHEPQLTKTGPAFVIPSAVSYPISMSYSGNFEFAAKPGFAPTLSVSGHQYQVSENTTQNLKFSVPVSELFPSSNSSDLYNYQHTIAELVIPWQSSSVLGLRHQTHADHYRVIVGALPASPGKIMLQHTVVQQRTETKRFKSRGYTLSSQREGGNDDHKNVPFSVTPDTGWHVVRGTSSLDKSCHGDTSSSFGGDDGDHVVYVVTTIHHGIGSSGICDFSISFDETRTVQDTVPAPDEAVEIKWGDSKSFSYPAGSWKLVFDSFDGHHAEFTGSDETNRFVKIRNQAGSWVIGTADPATLIWP